jgi:hypothetical protein
MTPKNMRELSACDKPVRAVETLNGARARKGKMRADETLLVCRKLIEETQAGRYSAVGLVIGWNPPRRVSE